MRMKRPELSAGESLVCFGSSLQFAWELWTISSRAEHSIEVGYCGPRSKIFENRSAKIVRRLLKCKSAPTVPREICLIVGPSAFSEKFATWYLVNGIVTLEVPSVNTAFTCDCARIDVVASPYATFIVSRRLEPIEMCSDSGSSMVVVPQKPPTTNQILDLYNRLWKAYHTDATLCLNVSVQFNYIQGVTRHYESHMPINCKTLSAFLREVEKEFDGLFVDGAHKLHTL